MYQKFNTMYEHYDRIESTGAFLSGNSNFKSKDEGVTKMDETKEILTAIIGRLEEMGADMKGMKAGISELKADVSQLKADVNQLKADVSQLKADVETLKEGQIRMEERLDRIEANQEYFSAKWLEHDKEILRLKRQGI
jgi:outer membrane murein-binding lipoprotein Lpp